MLWPVMTSTSLKQSMGQAEEQAHAKDHSQEAVVEEDGWKDWRHIDATVPVIFHLRAQSNSWATAWSTLPPS